MALGNVSAPFLGWLGALRQNCCRVISAGLRLVALVGALLVACGDSTSATPPAMPRERANLDRPHNPGQGPHTCANIICMFATVCMAQGRLQHKTLDVVSDLRFRVCRGHGWPCLALLPPAQTRSGHGSPVKSVTSCSLGIWESQRAGHVVRKSKRET